MDLPIEQIDDIISDIKNDVFLLALDAEEGILQVLSPPPVVMSLDSSCCCRGTVVVTHQH